MTLVLTWFSEGTVVQASDTRMSYIVDGRVTRQPRDILRKCIFVVTRDAHCALAYSGLAEISHDRAAPPMAIEEWLASEIAANADGTLLPQVCQHVARRLDEVLPNTRSRFPASHSGITVTLSGFSYLEHAAVQICISNQEVFGFGLHPAREGDAFVRAMERGSKIQISCGQFTITVGIKRNARLSILAHGDVRGLSRPIVNRLWRVARQLEAHGSPPGAIRRLLVETIREARGGAAANTVSRDCWSISLAAESRTATAGVHWADVPRSTAMLPRMVGPHLSLGALNELPP